MKDYEAISDRYDQPPIGLPGTTAQKWTYKWNTFKKIID